MGGLIETTLTRRFGQPMVVQTPSMVEHRWNTENESNISILFRNIERSAGRKKRFAVLKKLYGDFIGGFLVGDSLKIATLVGTEIFGLGQIEALHRRDEVGRARSLNPHVCFFMDAANVWYYGVKDDDLYVFDADTGEIDRIGPVDVAIDNLITQWEEAQPGMP